MANACSGLSGSMAGVQSAQVHPQRSSESFRRPTAQLIIEVTLTPGIDASCLSPVSQGEVK